MVGKGKQKIGAEQESTDSIGLKKQTKTNRTLGNNKKSKDIVELYNWMHHTAPSIYLRIFSLKKNTSELCGVLLF